MGCASSTPVEDKVPENITKDSKRGKLEDAENGMIKRRNRASTYRVTTEEETDSDSDNDVNNRNHSITKDRLGRQSARTKTMYQISLDMIKADLSTKMDDDSIRERLAQLDSAERHQSDLQHRGVEHKVIVSTPRGTTRPPLGISSTSDTSGKSSQKDNVNKPGVGVATPSAEARQRKLIRQNTIIVTTLKGDGLSATSPTLRKTTVSAQGGVVVAADAAPAILDANSSQSFSTPASSSSALSSSTSSSVLVNKNGIVSPSPAVIPVAVEVVSDKIDTLSADQLNALAAAQQPISPTSQDGMMRSESMILGQSVQIETVVLSTRFNNLSDLAGSASFGPDIGGDSTPSSPLPPSFSITSTNVSQLPYPSPSLSNRDFYAHDHMTTPSRLKYGKRTDLASVNSSNGLLLTPQARKQDMNGAGMSPVTPGRHGWNGSGGGNCLGHNKVLRERTGSKPTSRCQGHKKTYDVLDMVMLVLEDDDDETGQVSSKMPSKQNLSQNHLQPQPQGIKNIGSLPAETEIALGLDDDDDDAEARRDGGRDEMDDYDYVGYDSASADGSPTEQGGDYDHNLIVG